MLALTAARFLYQRQAGVTRVGVLIKTSMDIKVQTLLSFLIHLKPTST